MNINLPNFTKCAVMTFTIVACSYLASKSSRTIETDMGYALAIVALAAIPFTALAGLCDIMANHLRQKLNAPRRVAYKDANLEKVEHAELHSGVSVPIGGGRTVSVFRVTGHEGLCVQLVRPDLDGNQSHLTFGLTPPAAEALYLALAHHMGSADEQEDVPVNPVRN